MAHEPLLCVWGQGAEQGLCLGCSSTCSYVPGAAFTDLIHFIPLPPEGTAGMAGAPGGQEVGVVKLVKCGSSDSRLLPTQGAKVSHLWDENPGPPVTMLVALERIGEMAGSAKRFLLWAWPKAWLEGVLVASSRMKNKQKQTSQVQFQRRFMCVCVCACAGVLC